MAELKTKSNDESIDSFLKSIEDEQKREDCNAVLAMMELITKVKPKMWGGNIIGFGTYHYKYASGRQGDWFIVGLAPRKNMISLYINSEFSKYHDLLSNLGKYKTGKACLNIKRLDDVDQKVLKQLLTESVKSLNKLRIK